MAIDTSALQAALAALPSQMRASSLQAAASAGARVVAKEAKGMAPVRTGALKASIRSAVGRSRRVNSKRSLIYLKGTVYRIGHLVEFGTAHSRAQPFLRPAIERAFNPALAAAAARLGQHLERNAKKLAGKGGRAHFARGLARDARKRKFAGR